MVLDSVKSPTREAIIQITKLVAANAARSMPQNKYLLKTISRLIMATQEDNLSSRFFLQL